MRVSTATRLCLSSRSRASRIESLIASAILSGWPSVTDSEVNRRRDTALLVAVGFSQVGRSLPAPVRHSCTAPDRGGVGRQADIGTRGGPDEDTPALGTAGAGGGDSAGARLH